MDDTKLQDHRPRAGHQDGTFHPSDAAGPPLAVFIERIGSVDALDGAVTVLDAAAAAVPDAWLPVLSGRWLGHPLHPVLTDLPIGCWTSAWVLDIIGGRRAAPAARRLVGLGVLTAVPTVLAGLAEADAMTDLGTRRRTAVHTGANLAATAVFAGSWWARRHHRGTGVALTWVASAMATAGAAIGGHLAFPPSTPTSGGGSGPPHLGEDRGAFPGAGVMSDARPSELGDLIG